MLSITRTFGAVFILTIFVAGAVLAKDEDPVAVGVVTEASKRVVKLSPSGKATIEILNQGKGAFLGILTLEAGAQVPLHRDESEEHVYILEGGGEIILGGKKVAIKAGDSVLMPAGLEVSFKNGASKLVVVQVFAGPKSAEKYESWVERRD